MELVKPMTSDHELIKLAAILGITLDGIMTIDEVEHSLKTGTYIILLRRGDGVGHWVCTHNGEYFDSTAVGPPTKLGNLPYNEFQYQGSYADWCGIWCMLWLYAKQKNKPELLKGMTDLNIDVLGNP